MEIPKADFEIDPRLAKFKGHFVYVWLRGNALLYVGVSRNPLARIAMHHVIDVIDKVLETDRLLLWECDTRENALELEAEYHRQYNPAFSSSSRVPQPWVNLERRAKIMARKGK